jgi:HTH-type transcriptional regulator, cell division transcriptional repressor
MDKKFNKLPEEKNKPQVLNEIQERAYRLRFLRKMTALSMKEFAQHCNIGLTTLNYWEQAYSSITERGAKKVSSAMKEEGIECSTLWLMSGLGDPPKITDSSKLYKLNYPLIKPYTQTICERNSEYFQVQIKEEIKLFQTRYPDSLVYFINDGSMQPLYRQGDIVAGKKLIGKNMELAHGTDCIVEFEKNNLAIRRVRIGQSINSFDLYVIHAESSLEFPPLRNKVVSSLAPISRIWKFAKF